MGKTKEPQKRFSQAADEKQTAPNGWIPLRPGDMAGEYRITALIARGGAGWVYAADHPVIQKKAAVKVIRTDFLDDEDAVRRFVDEARAVNVIGHPNIVDIFAYGRLPSGHPYFVMQFLQGQSLRARLRHGPPLDGPELNTLITETLQALAAAHRAGIVHRDLKPDNIFLQTRSDGSFAVKVLDFGVAKLSTRQRPDNVTQNGVPIGTPTYMAPEQCRGDGVDARTDLYAFGVVLYELFCGRPPFVAAAQMEILFAHIEHPPPPPGRFRLLPAALEKTILTCLRKNSAGRPANADQLEQTLRQLLDKADKLTSAVTSPAAPETPAAEPFARPLSPEAPDERPTVRKTTPTTQTTIPSGTAFFGDRQAGSKSAASVPKGRLGEKRRIGIYLTVFGAGLASVGIWFYLRSRNTTDSVDGARSHPPVRQRRLSPARNSNPAMSTLALDTVPLTLRSQPAGARVYLGSRMLGTTPTRVRVKQRTAPQNLRFVLDGGPAEARTVVTETVVTDRPRTIDIALGAAKSQDSAPPRNPAPGEKKKATNQTPKRSRAKIDISDFKLKR